MCGIAGIVGKDVRRFAQSSGIPDNSKQTGNISAIRRMTNSIAHRGPDGDGVAVFDNCLLGHRRLSIIDLSTGDQPMYSNQKACIAFNGEFYGFKEVKTQLSYPFKTSSDTEVILALYHQYGAEHFVEKVKGMFAFGLWDEDKQLFVAARDRFGEKPFYYALTRQNELVYGSEIKVILASGLIEPELNLESVAHYLQHLYVHPHHSIYKDIFVLPPGHFLMYENGNVEVKKYWHLPETQLLITFEEAKDECYRLLNKSVQNQLIADVPVGAFLSGGLDSSTITALAAKCHPQQLTTISFSFGNEVNELPYSRQIAQKYNTNSLELHHDDFDIADLFVEMSKVYDEPFADSSNIPTYLICKEAAKALKVVLTGDAGDELFGGYTGWYKPLVDMQRKDFSSMVKNWKKKVLNPHYGYELVGETHIAQNSYFKQNELNKLCLFKSKYSHDKFTQNPYNTVDAAMRQDLQDYMPGDILVKTDRAAMANSLELRAPFLDVEFSEFMIALPESFKTNGDTDKILMRETFKDLWTDDIRDRKKQGFGAPVGKWLQQNKMKDLKRHFLENKNNPVFELINFDQAQTISAKDNYQTWILLTLATWMQQQKP